MIEKKDLVELKYGDQPEKYKDHILIFDGRKGINENASLVASKLYHILKKLGKNPVIYTNNDTINPDKIKTVIITNIEEADGIKKLCIENNISFDTILDNSYAESYCNSLKAS